MLVSSKEKLYSVFLFGVFVFTLSGCTPKQSNSINMSLEQIEPDNLFSKAQEDLRKNNSAEALKKLSFLNSRYTFNSITKKSLMVEAYLDYKSNLYQEAINASERYITLYPNSSDLDYAYYLIGLSYFVQIPTVTQDQSLTIQAVTWFTKLIKEYPHSVYISSVQKKLKIARNQLAGKEMEIGRYYLKRHTYLAALNRFNSVIETYSDTSQTPEALARLVECYLTLGLQPSAENAAHVLGQNYSSSSWYKYAFELLESSGTQPKSDRGKSWLSKKFHS